MSKGIWRFVWDVGRSGSLHGIFVADKKAIDELVGQWIDFGEVLGKHSEVWGEIEADDFELVTDNPEAVAMFVEYNLQTGYNPFDYLPEEYDDE